MKLLVEVIATFVLIYWPAALMAVRSVLDDGEASRARFAYTVVPAVIFLPALLGLVFYLRDWTFLWFSASTFLTASLVLPLIASVLLGFPRALFDSGRSDAEGYTVGRRAVYYAGVPLQEVDPQSFETLSARIGRDQRHVFRGAEVLIGAEPQSFEVLADSDYQRDARRVYYLERVIPGAEPATFARIARGGRPTRFWRDARSVYFLGKRIGLADVATFEPLTQRYARDGQRVFHDGEVVYEADAASFEVVGRSAVHPVSHDAHDKHRRYLRGKAI